MKTAGIVLILGGLGLLVYKATDPANTANASQEPANTNLPPEFASSDYNYTGEDADPNTGLPTTAWGWYDFQTQGEFNTFSQDLANYWQNHNINWDTIAALMAAQSGSGVNWQNDISTGLSNMGYQPH